MPGAEWQETIDEAFKRKSASQVTQLQSTLESLDLKLGRSIFEQ
jgi:hypothetical protein